MAVRHKSGIKMSRIARFRCTEQKPVPSHWVGSGGPFQNMHVCLEAFTRPITDLPRNTDVYSSVLLDSAQ
jgi:hypothetical protein